MSVNIPEKFSRQEFNKLLNHLKDSDLTKYSDMIKKHYKKPKGSVDYSLKDDISAPISANLDYVFRRLKQVNQFDSLDEIAQYFRKLLEDKKCILLFAYNGIGKTRLSSEFKTLGQTINDESGGKTADTLYYNAFTEDLFYWDNDLENDKDRFLKLNSDSRFFSGLKEMAMEKKIRPFLHRYANFDFKIDYADYKISFYRGRKSPKINNIKKSQKNDNIEESPKIDNIKVSRGEENIFIWCFFLAVVQMVVDKVESYNWVKYIYIDDPISSLDDNNVIAVACQLSELLKGCNVKTVISTHHTLFYNVMCNEFERAERVFMQKKSKEKDGDEDEEFILKDTSKTPFFHHVAMLKELKKAADSGNLFTYHFNILRSILEKTAAFHGFENFSACLRGEKDEDPVVYRRIINILSHGNYSIFEPKEMVDDNKEIFRNILERFQKNYKFNDELFTER